MPEFFNTRVNVHIALNPRTDLQRTNGQFISVIWFIWGLWQRLVQDAGWAGLLDREKYIADAQTCTNNIAACSQQNGASMNADRLPFFAAHKMAGISWMTIEHNAQIGWY